MLFFQFLGLYLLIGLATAIAFAFSAAGRAVEPQAHISAPARILLIPGAMILWPLVLARWLRARRAP